jgi:hypothetical protein
MSTRQQEAELLKHTIGFDDCQECRKLVERIAQVERDQRCVQRAASLMTGFTVLAAVGFGYGLALQENFPHGPFRVVAGLIFELGLASLISVLIFAGLWLTHRRKLNGLLKECQMLVTKFLELRQAELPREPSAFGAGLTGPSSMPNRQASHDGATAQKQINPSTLVSRIRKLGLKKTA